MPLAHEHAHSQIAQSVMRNPPVQSHGFQKDAQNTVNVNPTSYRGRGETLRAPQRSEVRKSHEHAQNEVRRPHARLLPSYSQRPYQISVAKSSSKSTPRETPRQKSV